MWRLQKQRNKSISCLTICYNIHSRIFKTSGSKMFSLFCIYQMMKCLEGPLRAIYPEQVRKWNHESISVLQTFLSQLGSTYTLTCVTRCTEAEEECSASHTALHSLGGGARQLRASSLYRCTLFYQQFRLSVQWKQFQYLPKSSGRLFKHHINIYQQSRGQFCFLIPSLGRSFLEVLELQS